MEQEIWKPVRGYIGKYEVSNKGFVRTLSWKNKEGDVRLLTRTEDEDGYYRVALCRRGEVKPGRGGRYIQRPIAQLVAEAFVPKPRFKPSDMRNVIVIHINGDRKDDRAENLRWATIKTACNKPSCKERRTKSGRGKYGGPRKEYEERAGKKPLPTNLNISRVRSTPVVQLTLRGEFIREWDGATTADRELKQSGVIQARISDCCRGKRYSAGGYRWMFKKDYENVSNH